MTEPTTTQDGADLAPLVSPRQAADRIAEGALLIDVRSEAGRSRAGAIPGAVVVDRTALDELFLLDSPTRLSQVAGLDQEIVVVCGSVAGSGPVAAGLRERGFTRVSHVEGGFPAWKAEGLETEEPTAPPED